MIEDKFLVVSVNGIAHNAEQSENLEVFLLVVVSSFGLADVVGGEVVDDLAGDEIIDKEVIIAQQFLKKIELTGHVAGNHIVEDELKPLRNVHLE